jgi:hypothetical protein
MLNTDGVSGGPITQALILILVLTPAVVARAGLVGAKVRSDGALKAARRLVAENG